MQFLYWTKKKKKKNKKIEPTKKNNKTKEAHAQAKAHAHAHAHAQTKAHAQAKRHMQLHEVDSISLSKKWNSEKQKCKFPKNKCSMLPVVNSQSRVFQNDSKYSKSELQGTSDSKQLTLTSQKRNLSHVQSTCSSKTPRTQLPSLRSAAEANPTRFAAPL